MLLKGTKATPFRVKSTISMTFMQVKDVHVPGCRRTVFDCFHMHWRWNGPLLDPVQTASDPLIDVLVEPSDDGRIDPLLAGTPYLVSGQKIDIGIVKFNSAEQKFLNPSSFERPNADPFSFANNNEQIGLGVRRSIEIHQGNLSKGRVPTKLGFGTHILLYYVASSLESHDTFFRHGIYVLDTSGKGRLLNVFQVPNCGEQSPLVLHLAFSHRLAHRSDTGQGIDPEIMPRLFTKFATKMNFRLGLYISKGIIEAHGGKMA